MAKDLELRVHAALKQFPVEEKFRSVDQISRSSSSVTNNIAEAYYKRLLKNKEYTLRDVVIGELEETRTNLLRCGEKKFLNEKAAKEIAGGYDSLRMAIFGYLRFLRNYKNSSTV